MPPVPASSPRITLIATLIGCAITTLTIRSLFEIVDADLSRLPLGGGEEVMKRKILQVSRMGVGKAGAEKTVSTMPHISRSYERDISATDLSTAS